MCIRDSPLAQAKVLKTRTEHSPGTDTTILTDDTLTYRLDLKVDNIQINSQFNPAPYTGTNLPNFTGGAQQGVLISDVIPTYTKLTDFDPSTPAVFDQPSSPNINGATWQLVYTTSALTVDPLSAVWVDASVTAIDAVIAPTVTRIGWFYKTDAGTAAPIVADDLSLALGYTTTTDANGLKFKVVTSGVGALTNLQITNIAQTFGQTYFPVDTDGIGGVDTVSPLVDTNADGIPDKPVIIYDESGDDKPNNFSDTNTPKDNLGTPSIDGSYYNPLTDFGEATPNTQDVDRNNNNTGTDRDPNNGGGEDNLFNLTLSPEAPSGILNGPDAQINPRTTVGFPSAVGPNSNHDDFVEKAGHPTILTTPVDFFNTIRNPASNATDLDNVVLLPITAAIAEGASGHNGFGTILIGTTVTISYDGNKDGLYTGTAPGGPDQTATYTYGAGGWTLTTGTNLPTNAGGVTIPKLIRDNNSGGIYDADYQVTITPPGGAVAGDIISVPIVAYPENTTVGGGTFDKNTDSVFNITIDRLFVGGLLTINKSVRLLDASGNVLQPYSVPVIPTTSPTWNPKPGEILEYKIEYKNNGTRNTSGAGNVTLQAIGLKITEDGTIDWCGDTTLNANGNNWALNNTGTSQATASAGIDTSHVNGGANASRGTISYNTTNCAAAPFVPTYTSITERSGTSWATDVPVYINDLGATSSLGPQETGEFTFRRRVN